MDKQINEKKPRKLSFFFGKIKKKSKINKRQKRKRRKIFIQIIKKLLIKIFFNKKININNGTAKLQSVFKFYYAFINFFFFGFCFLLLMIGCNIDINCIYGIYTICRT